MKIKYPILFPDEILEAKLVKMPSMFSRDITWVIEIVGMPVQIQAPGNDCIFIDVSDDEKQKLTNSHYNTELFS